MTLLRCALALVFGMALTMAFAPAYAWWFAPYCVAGLLLLLDVRARSAFAIGACFGLGWFGAGFWWILPALANFSDAGMLFSVQLTAALVLYLSLFPACAAVLIARCRRVARPGLAGRLSTAIQIALIFAIAEWARGTLFGGFPMLATGYAHSTGPLAGFAPLIGVYGLGMLNAFIAALLASAGWQPHAQQRWRLWGETVVSIGVVLFGGAALAPIDWTTDTGRTLTVSLLQGNLAQADKFSDVGLEQAVGRYLDLAAAAPGQLIVLPETALPVEWSAMPPAVVDQFQAIADARKATIVIGSVVYRAAEGGRRAELRNSAIGLRPLVAGGVPYRYDKQHLVPFAESLPYGTGWIGNRLGMAFNGLTPGVAEQAPLTVAGARVALSICFEDLFDTAMAEKARDAELLLNLSNFAWFPGSYAPVQHLQVARLRALETGRWFVQVANTGVTAVIDAHGRVRQELPVDEVGVLSGEVRLLTGKTPFMALGNWPLLVSALLVGVWTRRERCNCGLLGVEGKSFATTLSNI